MNPRFPYTKSRLLGSKEGARQAGACQVLSFLFFCAAVASA